MNEKENAFILTGDVKATKSTLPITLSVILFHEKNGCINTIMLNKKISVARPHASQRPTST